MGVGAQSFVVYLFLRGGNDGAFACCWVWSGGGEAGGAAVRGPEELPLAGVDVGPARSLEVLS